MPTVPTVPKYVPRLFLKRFDEKTMKKFKVLKPFSFTGDRNYKAGDILDLDDFKYHDKESKVLIVRRTRQLYQMRHLQVI